MGMSDRKVKGPYDSAAKKATACCRKVGACETCRRGNKKVSMHQTNYLEYQSDYSQCDLHQKSPYEPCTACAVRKKTYKGIPRIPCFLSQMSESVFFRKGELCFLIPSWLRDIPTDAELGPSVKSPHYSERQAVYDLTSVSQITGSSLVEVRTLKLSQNCGTDLEVYVAKFVKGLGDKVDRKELNEDREQYILEMPHYCLTDIDKIKSNLMVYIGRTRNNYLETLLQNGSDITRLTTRLAIGYATQYPVNLMHLWNLYSSTNIQGLDDQHGP